MIQLHERIVTDRGGRQTGVILPRRDFQKLLSYLEDLEDRLEIKRRKRDAVLVPWEDAKAALKRSSHR